jgi:hypothetical protein
VDIFTWWDWLLSKAFVFRIETQLARFFNPEANWEVDGRGELVSPEERTKWTIQKRSFGYRQ